MFSKCVFSAMESPCHFSMVRKGAIEVIHKVGLRYLIALYDFIYFCILKQI